MTKRASLATFAIYMFFKLLYKVNLVAKIMQSAYLCVTFHVKHKKITISRDFDLISYTWGNPGWRPS